MRKQILLAIGIAGVFAVQPKTDAHADLRIGIEIPGGPGFSFESRPDFIYLDDYGFSVSYGGPHDVIYYGNAYFVFRNGYWFRAYDYRGPWGRINSYELPGPIRRHGWNEIRRFRDMEYRRHDRRYWDDRFRQDRERGRGQDDRRRPQGYDDRRGFDERRGQDDRRGFDDRRQPEERRGPDDRRAPIAPIFQAVPVPKQAPQRGPAPQPQPPQQAPAYTPPVQLYQPPAQQRGPAPQPQQAPQQGPAQLYQPPAQAPQRGPAPQAQPADQRKAPETRDRGNDRRDERRNQDDQPRNRWEQQERR
jgi:hypothetical protein